MSDLKTGVCLIKYLRRIPMLALVSRNTVGQQGFLNMITHNESNNSAEDRQYSNSNEPKTLKVKQKVQENE